MKRFLLIVAACVVVLVVTSNVVEASKGGRGGSKGSKAGKGTKGTKGKVPGSGGKKGPGTGKGNGKGNGKGGGKQDGKNGKGKGTGKGKGGHAISLTGYTHVEGERYFLIKNSWGEKWGDGGYAWIHEQSLRMIVRHGPVERALVIAELAARKVNVLE